MHADSLMIVDTCIEIFIAVNTSKCLNKQRYAENLHTAQLVQSCQSMHHIYHYQSDKLKWILCRTSSMACLVFLSLMQDICFLAAPLSLRVKWWVSFHVTDLSVAMGTGHWRLVQSGGQTTGLSLSQEGINLVAWCPGLGGAQWEEISLFGPGTEGGTASL